MSKNYGYIRVSTKEQNIDRQMSALLNAGLVQNEIFIDKVSGKNFNRKGYKKMVRRLKADDVVFIKSIDRLGRNYDEILDQWRFLTVDKNVDIVVIDFPLLDTRKQLNGITGKFIADMVLQVLSYVAQIERENIRQRQAEGIIEAKKRGVRFGRPKLDLPENFEAVFYLWLNGEISQREAARQLQVSHATFLKWAHGSLRS